ncbi:ATP-binding protein, partial [Streptomyces bobili]
AADGIRLAVRDHSDVVPDAACGPGADAACGPGALPAGHHGSGYGWPLIIRLARDIRIGPRPSGGKTISVFAPVRTDSGGAP